MKRRRFLELFGIGVGAVAVVPLLPTPPVEEKYPLFMRSPDGIVTVVRGADAYTGTMTATIFAPTFGSQVWPQYFKDA